MSRRLFLVSLALLLVTPALARADAASCTKTLGKSIGSYLKARQKTIAGCENRRSSGKLSATTICRPQCASGAYAPGAPCRVAGDCPVACTTDADCMNVSGACVAGSCPIGGGSCCNNLASICQAVSDATTGAKLTKAATNATSKITGACTGVSPLPALGPACDSAADANALAACVTAAIQDLDNDTLNADTLSRTVYVSAAPVDPSLVKCQAAIGKALGKYLATRVKGELKCQTSLASGKIPGPCPDAATATALGAARAKLDSDIRKKCSETQLAANSPPKLDFGRPCEAYKVMTYTRDGVTNNNSIPVTDRLIPCLADAAAGVADRMVDIAYPGRETSAFDLGVAAGDATDTAAIFWTRLPDGSMSANLDLSTDPTFATATQTIPISAPGGDGVVKEEVGSLLAKRTYFYRFRQGANTSAVGRVVTMPSPADATTLVHVGWNGDSNAFYRPFNSLDPLRLLAPDAWLYIGDTIYGDDAAADGVDAMTQPEYEAKYRLNRADASLRHLIESTGTYAQWDDHEVRNDFAGAVPAFATRMIAGNAAFRRYMPLRENGTDPMQLYRSVRAGSGSEFFLIDDRQYRSAKYTCCNDSTESAFINTDDDTSCHVSGEATLPSSHCTPSMSGSGRTILGATQKTWLENGLMNSTATFKFIMNGPPITQLLFLPYDRWEAWSSERDEILDFVETNNIKNVVWLSTDLHAVVYSPTHLNSDNSTHPGIELVIGPVGETTLFRELPASIVSVLGVVPGLLKQVTEYQLDRYNSVLITVDPTAIPPTARFDIYDRTGAAIDSVSLTATP